MAYIEDLEEFDAELELRLKREYATVFGLFRYCVLTAEATYLCNRLEVERNDQSAYPFARLVMEDVWVWDKARPTRIIPRTEVHTTQDVTIEELKTDDDVATGLRAERRVVHRCCSRSTSATRRRWSACTTARGWPSTGGRRRCGRR